MRYLFILICLISEIAYSQSDNMLGTGVIRFSNPTDTLNFYGDTINSIIKKQIPFSKRESNFKTLESNNFLTPVQSMEFDGDGNLLNLDLICLDKKNKWCYVNIHYGSEEKYWIKIDNSLTFNTWDDYLKSMLCITRRKATDKIYKTNDLKSDTIDFKKYECFRVLEISGYWLKIGYYQDSTDKYNGDTVYIGGPIIDLGWIIWRDSNSLLINYYDN
jgi:hypothetical protein